MKANILSKTYRVGCSSRNYLSFVDCIRWIRERNVRLLAHNILQNSQYQVEPIKINTTPNEPLSFDHAKFALKNQCMNGRVRAEYEGSEYENENTIYFEDDRLHEYMYRAFDVVATFPIWDYSDFTDSDGQGWITTEEAENVVIYAHKGAMSRDKALRWLVDNAAMRKLVVLGAEWEIAERIYGSIMGLHANGLIYDRAQWARSSLILLLASAAETLLPKSNRTSKSGRPEKDFWAAVRFEAGAWLGHNGGENEGGSQSALADFLMLRAEAHGGSLGRSQAMSKAKEMIAVFQRLKGEGSL